MSGNSDKSGNGPKLPVQKNISAMSLGLNMAAGMAVFSYLGYLIDEKAGGTQIWTLVGIFLGLFYCGYEVWKIVRKSNDQELK